MTGTRADRSWRDRASCRDADPDLFFPADRSAERLDQARAVCLTCPVRAACLVAALASGAGAGVWAGTTPEERRRLRRRTQITAVARTWSPGSPPRLRRATVG